MRLIGESQIDASKSAQRDDAVDPRDLEKPPPPFFLPATLLPSFAFSRRRFFLRLSRGDVKNCVLLRDARVNEFTHERNADVALRQQK